MIKFNKYKNKKIVYDNIKFDSNLEKDFYIYLLNSFKKEDIIIQPKFNLLPKFEKNNKKYRCADYVADFQVNDVVYDVKTMITATPVFKLKEKLFNYFYKDLILICVNKTTKKMQSEGYDEFCEYKIIEDYRKKNKKEKNNEKDEEI